MRRHLHRLGIHPGLKASIQIIRAVGIVASQPEAEGLADCSLLQKLLEIIEELACRILSALAVVDPSGSSLELPRRPGLGIAARRIAGLFEELYVGN